MVLSKILSQYIEHVALVVIRVGKVVDRFDERPAKKQSPDAIGRGSLETAVAGIGNPRGKALPPRPQTGKPFGMKRNGFRDRPFFERLAIFDLIFDRLSILDRLIFDSHDRLLHLTVKCRQSFEFRLLPVLKGMIVALGAVDALSEEGANRLAGELILIHNSVVDRRR